MSKALTVRLPDKDAAEVRSIAKRERRSVSDIGARIVDEWLRQNRYPYIEFRSINGERVACIKGRIEVWQVIMAAQTNRSGEAADVARSLNLSLEQVHAALDYAAAYPNEIEPALAESRQGYERLHRLFPHIDRTQLTDKDLESIVLSESPTQGS